MNINERLKLFRSELGLKQIEVCEVIGVSDRAYIGYEGGRSIPGGEVLAGFIKLGLNVNWLLSGEGEMFLKAANNVIENKEAQLQQKSIVINRNPKIENDTNKVDQQKYFNDLQVCLRACQRLHGEDFNKMDATIQNKYAKDLHEKLQKYFQTFWPFYNSLYDCSLDLMGDDGVYNELQNLKKLSAVMKFPYNPNEDIYKI